MENHVPHADEHKLDFALFLDFSMDVPKSSTVIRKVQFRFNRVDVRVEKSLLRPRTMATLKTVQSAQTMACTLPYIFPSLKVEH